MSDVSPDNLKTILSSIEPSLTVGGVLLALFIASIKFGKFFWDHEREIAKENLERLKDILGTFKEVFIRPTLENKTREWVEAAYEEAVNKTADYISNSLSNAQQVTTAEVNNLFSTYNKKQLVADLKTNDRIDEFYSSPSGVSLLEKLDGQYLKARDFKRVYDLKISACRSLTYYFFLIAGIFLMGLVHLIVPLPMVIIYFFLYSFFLTVSVAIISFVKFEIYRRRLTSIWEELKTTGNINA